MAAFALLCPLQPCCGRGQACLLKPQSGSVPLPCMLARQPRPTKQVDRPLSFLALGRILLRAALCSDSLAGWAEMHERLVPPSLRAAEEPEVAVRIQRQEE